LAGRSSYDVHPTISMTPGGFKYSLLIVDFKTRHNFIYGLRAVTGEYIHNA
jgi:hypothetical protein